MRRITTFRGLSGEVIQGFLSPRVFLSFIPVVFIWAAFLLPLFLLSKTAYQHVPPFFELAVLMFCWGIAAGRFATQGAQGELNAPFFTTRLERFESIRFGLRFILVTLAWGTPSVFLLKYLIESALKGAPPFGSAFNPFLLIGLIEQPETALILAILVLAPLGLAVSLLIATATCSLADLVTLQPYRWVLIKRAADLLPFLCCFVGALLAFVAIYGVPAFFVTAFTFKVHFEAGQYLAESLIYIPALISPILGGRLAGALLSGDELMDELGRPIQSSKHRQPASGSSPEGGSSTHTGGHIGALSSDPNDKLVRELKAALISYPEVLAGYLYESQSPSSSQVTVGIELSSEAALDFKQQVLRTVRHMVDKNWPADRILVQLLTVNIEEKVRAIGLKVYQRH